VKQALIVILVCIVMLPSSAASQTKKRSSAKSSSKAAAAEKQLAEVRAGRERIATQIKTLTQFLYLLGSISKGIETAELANRNHEQSSIALPSDQIEKNKVRVKESIRNVRTGLDQLESSFRNNAALYTYYPSLSGVAGLGQTAENQAGTNNFDQAGRTLINAVNKLADALASIR